MLAAAVIARLKAQCPDLRSVEGALELAALMRANGLQQVGPGAFVVPLGERAGAVAGFTGLHVQPVTETVAAILVWRATDAARDRGAAAVDALRHAVIAALAGWVPDGFPGALRLVRGAALSVAPGSFAYTLEFALDHQLRISA